MYLQSRIQEQLENQDKLTKTSKTFEQRYIFSFFSFANQTLENSHPKNPNSSQSPQNKNPFIFIYHYFIVNDFFIHFNFNYFYFNFLKLNLNNFIN